VSGAEQPERIAPGHRVTVEDIRALVGPATPHFALQIRDRVARLIADLAPGDPARIEGDRAIHGHVQEHERPLPSLQLDTHEA
jgi:hypothetical protein